MSIKRRAKHINVVLERQYEPDGPLVVVARDLESMEATEKKAKELAIQSPGTTYIPCRLYPGIKAQLRRTVRFVDPNSNPGPGTDADEPQILIKGGKEEDAI